MIHAFIEHSFFKNLCAWIFFVKRSTTMKGETTMEFNTLSKIAIFPWHFFWPIFWPLYSSFSTPIWFSGPEQILEVGCPECNAPAGPWLTVLWIHPIIKSFKDISLWYKPALLHIYHIGIWKQKKVPFN